MKLQLSDVLKSEQIVRHMASSNSENSKSCRLILAKWPILKEAVYLLKIPFNVTIEFQSQKLTLSDVYHRWTVMQLHLKECTSKKAYKTGFANHLLDALKSRNKIIFQNPLMSCALYLDPRFQMVVTRDGEKAEMAKENIIKIWRRLNYLRNGSDSIVDTSNQSNKSTDSLSFEFNEQDAMMQHLNQTDPIQQNSSLARNDIPYFDIEAAIEFFQLEPLPTSVSVLKYWESIKDEQKELYEIAMVIFSVPPTEVQIERDFSSLEFVFSARRSSLSYERLEDIMLIFLNKDLYEMVSQAELDAVLTQPKIIMH